MPVGELERERGRIEELRDEVARVEVQPEAVAPPERGQRLPGRHEVVGDLRRVHLEPEPHAFPLEHLEDRPEALGDLVVASLDRVEVVRRERVEEMPDRRAGEPVHLRHAERRRGTRRVGEPLGGALPHALGLTVAPDLGREDRAVALVDRVADRLADEMRAQRPAAEARLLEQRAPILDVSRIGKGLGDVEVIAPAGELQAVEGPDGRTLGELRQRQVGPLAGEECDGPRHRSYLKLREL